MSDDAVADDAVARGVRVLWRAATAAAVVSAAVFVTYGALLRTLTATPPRQPTANYSSFVALVEVFFLAAGVGFAALFAWRYVAVARAARRGRLELIHRRRLRRARTTALMAVLVFALAATGAVTRLPPATPLALTGVVLATAWAGAAITTVKAERRVRG